MSVPTAPLNNAMRIAMRLEIPNADSSHEGTLPPMRIQSPPVPTNNPTFHEKARGLVLAVVSDMIIGPWATRHAPVPAPAMTAREKPTG